MPIFPDNARVLFLGDSITARNVTMAYVADHYHRCHPDSGVRFFNGAVSGGSLTTLHLYLEDNLRFQPTHAVIALGINDSRRTLLQQPRNPERYQALCDAFTKYQSLMRQLCEKLSSRGIAVTLCTPVPYAEYQEDDTERFPGGYALMAGYAEFIRSLAAERSLPLCDYHAYMTAAMQSELLYTGDRVHPLIRGMWHMANCFIASQGEKLAPQAPLPDYLLPWHTAMCRRCICYAAEWMIVKNYSLPTEEKLRIVQEFLAQNPPPSEFWSKLATTYIEDKPREEENFQVLLRLCEELAQS